jgi:hypothetical protein
VGHFFKKIFFSDCRAPSVGGVRGRPTWAEPCAFLKFGAFCLCEIQRNQSADASTLVTTIIYNLLFFSS